MPTFSLPEIDHSILESLPSPAMLVFADVVRDNIDHMMAVAGSVDRLRPHCKTHKMPAVVDLLLQRGIDHHKAATVAEAEMLCRCGAPDVVLAYNPVGPNIDRVVRLQLEFPATKLTVTCDHDKPLKQLADASATAGIQTGVMLDLDVGLQRTGVSPTSPEARELYAFISDHPALVARGFHIYDGHQRQSDAAERTSAVRQAWQDVLQLEDECKSAGQNVPELLCGGTPTFPVYARLDHPAIRLSPGTSVFHDVGYGSGFPDLGFRPAVAVVTRVVSRPASDRLTLDVGSKAIASDPPKGGRAFFPALPDAEQVIHNEEHLVLKTPEASRFEPGDILLAIPTHVCPTSALYSSAAVIDDGRLAEPWLVVARDRVLTI